MENFMTRERFRSHQHPERVRSPIRNSYSYADCHSNSNANCDRNAEVYTHATTSAYTAASSLALLGITGTRENKLASSQAQRPSKSLTNAGRAVYKGRSAS